LLAGLSPAQNSETFSTPSSQQAFINKTCSACQHRLDDLPLWVRAWTCPSCGAVHDRDHNAAKVILAAGRAESLNVRGAWLHVATDALGTLQTIVAGALIWWLGWRWADPAASIVIALLVMWSSWSLLRDAVAVLMEGVPRHLDVVEVRDALACVPGVVGVHDLHVWTITSGREALSAHLVVGESNPRGTTLEQVRVTLADRFGIKHVTVQLEQDECGDGC